MSSDRPLRPRSRYRQSPHDVIPTTGSDTGRPLGGPRPSHSPIRTESLLHLPVEPTTTGITTKRRVFRRFSGISGFTEGIFRTHLSRGLYISRWGWDLTRTTGVHHRVEDGRSGVPRVETTPPRIGVGRGFVPPTRPSTELSGTLRGFLSSTSGEQ